MVQKMPIPTRSAPRPPGNFGSQNNIAWGNNDPFGATSTMQPTQKKKPPPRPPPPKFKKDYVPKLTEDKMKKQGKPTELLTNLFGRRNQQKQDNINVAFAFSGNRFGNLSSQPSSQSDAGVSLIDLSPPGSPTFTTRSSSDGVSVDSFGSDGNSNPSVFTSSGNTSQTESAFEDDFDFFGNASSGKFVGNDPWKVTTSQDPFSPFASGNNGNSSNGASTKRIGDAQFFAFNNETAVTTNRGANFNYPVTNVTAPTMPTIIRARPPKPPAPKSIYRSLAPTVVDFKATTCSHVSSSVSASSLGKKVPYNETGATAEAFGFETEWPVAFNENPSPPMPSMPPPAPPSEFLTQVDIKPKKTSERPHGIALYDFAASQSGDLPLKQGDLVILTRSINDEWLEGCIDNRTGIFPANFIDIKVPLPGISKNIVNALYTFTGETWEDLAFEEGEKITVLSRISDDWLYGECRGKKGQFPSNYVDRVPTELPKYS